jgi:hypothetical protein
MSITEGLGRGPVTDIVSPYVGGTNWRGVDTLVTEGGGGCGMRDGVQWKEESGRENDGWSGTSCSVLCSGRYACLCVCVCVCVCVCMPVCVSVFVRMGYESVCT